MYVVSSNMVPVVIALGLCWMVLPGVISMETSYVTSLSLIEKSDIVEAHNKLRASVFPPAANMQKVVRISKLHDTIYIACV